MCVMCGMCLPYCPTYRINPTEAESPRGRISLIQAYAQGRLNNTASMQAHLDHCLGCTACEAMCPSRVPYGRLIDQYRALTAPQARHSFVERKLLDLSAIPGRLSAYSSMLAWARRLKLAPIIRAVLRLTGQSHLARLLEHSRAGTVGTVYPAKTDETGSVALFTGCMGTSFDSDTLDSAIQLLNRLGYRVLVPADQGCCGALHQHNGRIDQAEQLARYNQEVFQRLAVDTVIFTSNGCGDPLKRGLPAMETTDILSFLRDHSDQLAEHLSPLDCRVLIHESCSSLNKLATGGISREILSLIPELDILAFDSDRYCCGAGGSHQLTQPDITQPLLDLKLNEIRHLKPDYLVSDNIGCAVNFKTGVALQGIQLPVIHPVTLLRRHMK